MQKIKIKNKKLLFIASIVLILLILIIIYLINKHKYTKECMRGGGGGHGGGGHGGGGHGGGGHGGGGHVGGGHRGGGHGGGGYVGGGLHGGGGHDRGGPRGGGGGGGGIGHDAGGFSVSSAVWPSLSYYVYWIPGNNNTGMYKDWIYDGKICKNINSLNDLINCIPEIKDWPTDSHKWREIRPLV